MADSFSTATLAFDDVLIDFAGRRVLRGGVEQALEPKAFAVLALLAASPGRVFTRDESLDAIWSHRHVTPGVLNRIITLVRQTLGEDAQTARLLHTLHGVGYRFDLPTMPTAAEREQGRPARTVTVGAAEPVGDAGGFVSGSQGESSRRSLRGMLWSLLALVAFGVGGWHLWSRTGPGTASASAVAPPRPVYSTASPATLVVMPLKPIGDVEATRVIADGLGEELIGAFAQIGGLRVIARESTWRAAAETTDPAQLMQQLGITHALEGSLQQAGQRLRVRLRLVEARSSGTLWARDFDRDASEVLALQREIAQAVATSLTLEMGLDAASVAKGGDAEYLRRYLAAKAGLSSSRSVSYQQAETAETEFRALIRERADDARARAGLLQVLEIRAYRRPEHAQALRAEALEEATIVQRLDPALPESWYTQALAACRRNDWETCIASLEKAHALAPSGINPARNFHGNALMQLGYLDRAEAVRREMLVGDPINPDRSFNLGRTLDTQGRHEEALAYFDPDDLFQAYGRWFNAVWRRDHVAALHIAEHELGSDPRLDSMAVLLKPSYIAVSRALADPAVWPQAIAEMDRFERQTGIWNFSRVLAPGAAGSAAAIVGELDKVRRRAYSSWDLLLWTRDLAWLRADPAFQDYLRDNGILAYWRKHGFPKQCRPAGEGVACD